MCVCVCVCVHNVCECMSLISTFCAYTFFVTKIWQQRCTMDTVSALQDHTSVLAHITITVSYKHGTTQDYLHCKSFSSYFFFLRRKACTYECRLKTLLLIGIADDDTKCKLLNFPSSNYPISP